MRNIAIITKRELAAYFATPLAYIFIVIFLVLAGALTFFMGGLLQRGQADLQPFFTFHPWLYLFGSRPCRCGYGRRNGVPARSSCF